MLTGFFSFAPGEQKATFLDVDGRPHLCSSRRSYGDLVGKVGEALQAQKGTYSHFIAKLSSSSDAHKASRLLHLPAVKYGESKAVQNSISFFISICKYTFCTWMDLILAILLKRDLLHLMGNFQQRKEWNK